MINLPPISSLTPQERMLAGGRVLHTFPGSTELVKLDFMYEAGSLYQSQLLCAAATNKLLTVATSDMDSSALSEYLDYRGVVLDNSNSTNQSLMTAYFLRRHAGEVLPVLASMLERPAFDDNDFRLWQKARRQELATMEQRTSHMARRFFYEALFGREHPLGVHAGPGDVDRLEPDAVRRHFDRYYRQGAANIAAAGCVDEELLDLMDRHWGKPAAESRKPVSMGCGTPENAAGRIEYKMDGAVQTTLRVGRVLPIAWDDPDYARFMLLVTALGGYFGSRLMSNLREDKGYTYGIYAHTQIYRGTIVLFVTADVASGTAQAAVAEVMAELKRLCEEPMDDEELQLVKTVMVGDFLRSVDGAFELSTRYCDMYGTGVDERFTENIRAAVNETTAAQLQELAQRLLKVEDMTVCLAGA